MKSRDSDQLMLSVGALLASTREKRGIPIERAAKDTRMRPQRIRDMENDDLSHFTDPSYARMFLIAYAKYLDIPMQTIREHLPDRGEPGSEGYQYINTSTEDLPSLRRDLATGTPRRSRWLLGFSIAALLILGLGVASIVYFAVVNAERFMDRPAEVKIQYVESVAATNLQSEAVAGEAFDQAFDITAPPTPTPAPEMESGASLADGHAPAPGASEATTLPAPNIVVDDQAFLLGSPPEETPPPADHQ